MCMWLDMEVVQDCIRLGWADGAIQIAVRLTFLFTQKHSIIPDSCKARDYTQLNLL